MKGTRLGPYEIVEQLGAGGMGEVWLAQDTRLGRKVAIKVLPSEFASDPERLARFEQEARAAAALNHPHIAAVYDVGVEGDGDARTHFMVQEYLEGQTLGDLLAAGPLAWKRATALGEEIARALAAAHAAGIVHRDLKPANVFVSPAGHAKVLDFGLAKLTEPATAASGGEASMSPTVIGTMAGTVMGTAGYMAPEQVNGETVDRRADVFAFGCVLYEMVTGQRAFGGQSVPDTMAKILHSEPSAAADLAGPVPPELDRILTKCLAKDRDERYQHSDDLAVDLRAAQRVELTADAAATDAAATGHRPVRSVQLAAVGLACGLIAGAAVYALRPAEQAPRLRHYDIARSTSDRLDLAEISPDGSRVVYFAGGQLWLRELDEVDPKPLLATAMVAALSWSPDGRRVAYGADNDLYLFDVEDPEPILIAETPEPFGAGGGGITWLGDDQIVFCSGGGGLYRVPSSGGTPELWLAPAEGEVDFHEVAALPDGRGVLFTVHPGNAPDGSRLPGGVALFDGQERHTILDDGNGFISGRPVYAAEHVLYSIAGGVNRGIWAVPVSISERRVIGEATRLLSDGWGARAGRDALLYSVQGRRSGSDLVWSDGDGGTVEPTGITFEETTFALSLSPDGTRAALSLQESEETALWILDLADGSRRQITFERGWERSPSWSNDGEWIVYERIDSARDPQAEPSIWRVAASGQERPRRLADGWSPALSADDRTLYFVQGAGVSRVELGDGASIEQLFTLDAPASYFESPFRDMTLSPDGRALAFIGGDITRAFDLGVYLWDVRERGEPMRIADTSAARLSWSDDGTFLYFTVGAFGNARLARVRVSAGEQLAVSPTREFGEPGQHGYFDVGPDGRLLRLVPTLDPEFPSRLRIVQDWTELLPDRTSGGTR